MIDMLMNQTDYLATIQEIKAEIKKAQYKATVKVNNELLLLYYHIGQAINRHKVWGNKFIENLSRDLRLEYPDAKGYSERNLNYMSKFAERFPEEEILQEVLAKLSWYHVVTLMDKIKERPVLLWYAQQSVENGWSRNVLVHQIESNLYARQATADKISNFENRLPAPQSELATQMMKDPYIFDFIPFKADMLERDIENAMVAEVTKLLLELGAGFAFLGDQYHLNVGGEDFYLDLLFYNLKLRCYVVIELKTGDFKPEYAGKLNFYLTAVDKILKTEQDAPAIGLLLCKSKNDLIAEYALQDINKPIGVSEYRITEDIPEKFRQQLPSIEDIKNRIGKPENHKNV